MLYSLDDEQRNDCSVDDYARCEGCDAKHHRYPAVGDGFLSVSPISCGLRQSTEYNGNPTYNHEIQSKRQYNQLTPGFEWKNMALIYVFTQ